jgi:hypothetical protein
MMLEEGEGGKEEDDDVRRRSTRSNKQGIKTSSYIQNTRI